MSSIGLLLERTKSSGELRCYSYQNSVLFSLLFVSLSYFFFLIVFFFISFFLLLLLFPTPLY